MSTERNDGGSAFPSYGSMGEIVGYGMTLRDYFAAAALTGICASGPGHHMTNEAIATEAGKLADAMIKEREK